MVNLTKQAAEAEATLQAERAASTAEREKGYKLAQALKTIIALASHKDEEVE